MTIRRSPRGYRLRRLVWPSVAVLSVLAILIGTVLVAECAALGGKPKGGRLLRAQLSPQWHDEQFRNPQPLWADARGAWQQFLFGPATQGVEPDAPIPVARTDVSLLATPPASGLRVTWFGHSSVLLDIDGVRVLIDPLWSERPSPVAWAGPRRWYPPPVALNELPAIDAVVISHDHYDHLDYPTVIAMQAWPTVFVVPLGVGAHLSRWGIPDSRIVELDWWQSTRIGTLELTATPARHKSGRFVTQAGKTLWAGYAFFGAHHRVWYSGDSGFHGELSEVGERLGPFDVTMIDSGQYDAHWPDTHLGPELAVEAHRLVRGKVMMPVHWALLEQANHAWTEPVERVLAAARCLAVEVLVPRPGESIEPMLSPEIPEWWPRVAWQSASERPVVATKNGDPSERIAVTACPDES